VKFQSRLQQRHFQEMPRPMVILEQRADHLGPALRLAPGSLGNDRHINHVRLSPCAVLQPSLAKWWLLHTTLTPIAVECDRASRALPMAIAEADFGK
jgi:hypothetical protein